MHYIATLPHIQALGSGSFGQVNLCQDAAHGPVAVKFFYRCNFGSTAEWLKACAEALAEAQNMKALEHRNVVPIYQVLQGPNADEFLIVMQYCEGGSVAAVASTNVINLTEVKRLVRDAAIGLCYIHNRGYIHRDIKPDNIFRMSNGDVKIGDFGFVTDKLLLGFVEGAGTPEYIAPEVMKTLKCSILTDVYSLGATFLHLTHGDFWFSRTGKHAILKHLDFKGELWPVIADSYAFLPHVPVSWRKAIKKMTHSDPYKRYPSMEACVDAISRLPIVMDWQCVVARDSVSWSRVKENRVWRVEWKDYFTPTETWVAWSEDLDGTKKKTLGKSKPEDKPSAHYRTLQKWFADRE